MRSTIVTSLLLSLLAGCYTEPVLVMRDVVESEHGHRVIERPADAWRYIELQFPSMVSPPVRIHRVVSSRGDGMSVSDGGWVDQPIYFLPGTATFTYTCANGGGAENVALTFARAGSYTLDCAPDGSLVAIGPRASAF